MFDCFDEENVDFETTDEGFFMAFDNKSGLSADGATPEEAASNLEEEENFSFFEESCFDSF